MRTAHLGAMPTRAGATGPVAGELAAKLAASHLPALDGLRAISVLLVIVYHAGFPAPGGMGVLAFFVLSGFLITWLLLQEAEKRDGISIREFYIRRVLRIFPAFYCYLLLIGSLVLLLGKRIVWPQAAAAAFYVSNYYNAIAGDPDTFVSHTWSLGIEEQFYLLWPLAFSVLWRDPFRMTRVLVAAIAAVWAHRLLLQLVVGVDGGYIYEAFDTRLDHLLVGCLLAALVKRGAPGAVWRAACSRPFLPAVTIGLLGLSGYLQVVRGAAYRNLVAFVVDPLLIAVLMIQLIAFSSTGAWKWIDSPVARYLGRISYSLYLYQQVTAEVGEKMLPGQLPLVQLLVSIGATVAVASCSYFFVERPFLNLKKRLQQRPGEASRSGPPRRDVTVLPSGRPARRLSERILAGERRSDEP